MRNQALSAIIVAGATSLASAAPKPEESSERVSYRERARATADRPASESRIEITDATPASHGREYISVDPDVPLMSLQIVAAAGRPVVRAVRLDLVGGATRTIRVDRAIDRSHPAILDLRGPLHVERIVVTSEGSPKATYAITAERQTRAGVARR
jgi:hypothetical protein